MDMTTKHTTSSISQSAKKVSPNIWKLVFDVVKTPFNYEYRELSARIKGELTAEKATQIVADKANAWAQKEICESFRYNGNKIWLSLENQINYSNAFNIALQTNGSNLPYTVKCENSDGDIVFLKLATIEDITGFNCAINDHISKVLEECWKIKQSKFSEDQIEKKLQP